MSVASKGPLPRVLAIGFAAILSLPPTCELEAQSYASELYDGLEWTNIGPARGGRSTAVASSTSRPMEYYFGAAGGGLWKSRDGGTTWQPMTDGQLGSASVGAVQVCESNPDVVYIGTGETELRGNIQQGDGVYRSDDAGETWSHLGLKAAQNVARIRVHPEDCNTAWVAAFGVHSAPSPERGVYKTTDGGASWRRVLYRDERSGAVDISLDPNNPDVMYAALWEAWRKSWGMSSGGPGSGLFKSLDGGESWNEITRNAGLPEGVIGKIGVAVSPADPNRVWTLIEAGEGGVFRSDDAGSTWSRINQNRNLRQRAFYYTRIYADPVDRDMVYALNTGMYRSTDGGETFEPIQVPHGDNHDLWIDPANHDRMINANDGGANVTYTAGETWSDQDFSTAQFYRVTTTEHFPYHICGAQQDNSTACVPSKGWNHLSRVGIQAGGGGAGQSPTFLYSVGGGESGHIASNPERPNVFYAGSHSGTLTRYNQDNGKSRAVNIWPENPMGQSSAALVERVQWNFPIVFSRHDANVLYTASQKVWKTTNEGQTWVPISPDLTRADPMTMIESGGPLTKDQTGVEVYATVFALTPSFHDPNVIWAGSDDGYVHITRNGGDDWENITPPDAPDFVRINTIEASPNTPGKAYVAGIRYLVEDDRSPYVWKTEDYGQSWTKIVSGIPEDDFVRVVREDPHAPGLLYAGSETTVYVSWDDGASWHPLGINLPTVQVSDLVVEDYDLVIATHGRSFWVMRNMVPLRQLNAEVAAADVHLFEPVDAIRGVDSGVQVTYYLKNAAETVSLEFLDTAGNLIQRFDGTMEDDDPRPQRGRRGGGGPPKPSGKAGSHSFTWDLTYPGYTDFEGRIFWSAANTGPVGIPGSYQVRLTANSVTQTQSFAIGLDPRSEPVTMAQLEEQFRFAVEIRDKVSQANEAVIQIREIKGEVDDRLGQTGNAEIHAVGASVNTQLGDVEQEIYQVRNESRQDPLNFPIKLNNKLAALMDRVQQGEFGPTDQSRVVFERLSGLLQEEMVLLNLIIEQDLNRLNELLRSENLDPIVVQRIIS